jgi:nitroreductase
MEGFDPQEFAKIIELEDNLEISVILPIGYRAESENIRKKIRFTKEKLISIN